MTTLVTESLFGRRLIFVFSLVLALAAAACGSSSPTAPDVDVPYAQTDLRVGTGAEAVAGKRLLVNYAGWLYDAGKPDQKGQQFEASSYSFDLGARMVIKGWDQGLGGMKVGGVRRLIIPPSLGYGAAGNPPIPGNATLVFDVELVSVQ
jgi:FKBP-type peptidyl-prolyl cis-trans isomerase FkpA